MLPFCDRHVNVPRNDIAPVWTRSFPIAKEPRNLGEHLKKKRFGLGIRQVEAARILKVSYRSLSIWECDRLFPSLSYHSKIVAYLGYDPFKSPVNSMPK